MIGRWNDILDNPDVSAAPASSALIDQITNLSPISLLIGAASIPI